MKYGIFSFISELSLFLKKKSFLFFFEVIQAESKGLSFVIDGKGTKPFVPCAYNGMIHSIVIGLVELVMD